MRLRVYEKGEFYFFREVECRLFTLIKLFYRARMSPFRTAIAATIGGDLQAVLIDFTSAQSGAFLQGKPDP